MIYLLAVALVALAASFIDIRKYAGVMFLALVVAVVASYFVLDGNKQAARGLVAADELVLKDINIAAKSSSYRITGRVVNNSQTAQVLSFGLEVLAWDCTPEAESSELRSYDLKCVTIGEVEEQIFVEIPPGQARDFDDQVYFHGGKLNWNEHMRWKTRVMWVEAKKL
jgi:hypothetical protein